MSLLSDYLNNHIPSTMGKVGLVAALQGQIDRATVYRYLAGNHPQKPAESVLQAFASVLADASVVEMRASVNVPTGEDVPWVPTAEANRLNAGQRQALDLFIKATVAAVPEVTAIGGRDPVPADLPEEDRAQLEKQIQHLHEIGRSELAVNLRAALNASDRHAEGRSRR